MSKIKVLVVDDSALVRKILTDGLDGDPEINVVGAASNPYQAKDLIKKLNPDVMTLDVEMPRMDGVEFLRRLMPVRPMPVLMVSSLTANGAQITMDALEAGAVDFVTKPSADVKRGLSAMIDDLRQKVKAVSKAPVKRPVIRKAHIAGSQTRTLSLDKSTDQVIAIGASTGGTEAIKEIITRFPANMPGVVIAQHMPPGFTRMFAERLNKICAMDVKEAQDGDRIMNGRVLIAPGDYHLEIVRAGGMYKAVCHREDLVNGHRPSVEVLFNSVAKYAGKNSIGAILTGMGKDGAVGLKNMRDAGARTIGQDKTTSVVFGMPMEAFKLGACEKLLPITKIADEIVDIVKNS